ncbi:hypothetical protein FHS18_004368 [Paenibacillus phyllosphaerae]|uniref:Adenylyltransferase AadA C-terminal domain-containing protein n=1 Tax=Paenibacillus phyllosphaerae TaxID=274593 RepID=A0A7W5B0S6_9BACL|nr:aminoglycoside adenylyltransferase domain-containing protein [Paenibacillus phyllosphaerae]MBB3112282.1 hypothetical protein [Paenibacillus phyllosphaerae]
MQPPVIPFRISAGWQDSNVNEMLRVLLQGMQELLDDNLVGVYLRGSLALGDFDPATSDVDFLAATQIPVTDAALAALVDFHNRLAKFPNPYANELEGAYIDLEGLRRFQPGQPYPTLYRGEGLQVTRHQSNWVLERWTVREHGLTLLGPDPQQLIDPIPAERLRAAVSLRLRDWADWCSQVDDPAWQLPLSHKAYVIETMCRVLYTLANGEICSKPHAVAWALSTLPEPWRSLVERSQCWRTDTLTTPDDPLIAEVRRFLLWVTAQGA